MWRSIEHKGIFVGMGGGVGGGSKSRSPGAMGGLIREHPLNQSNEWLIVVSEKQAVESQVHSRII